MMLLKINRFLEYKIDFKGKKDEKGTETENPGLYKKFISGTYRNENSACAEKYSFSRENAW